MAVAKGAQADHSFKRKILEVSRGVKVHFQVFGVAEFAVLRSSKGMQGSRCRG